MTTVIDTATLEFATHETWDNRIVRTDPFVLDQGPRCTSLFIPMNHGDLHVTVEPDGRITGFFHPTRK